MIKKTDFFNFIILTFVYLAVNLFNLVQIPVFGDEAIYIRWSQIIKSVETLRFIPLTDGKQPLFMWVVVPFLKYINNPLFASRLVSVLSGLGTLLTIYLILRIIFKLKPFNCVITGIIYIFIPFAFFFNRLAVADNLLSFFGILSLFFCLLLTKYPRLDLSMILGGILGLAWLTKSPAMYFIILTFGTFIFINYSRPKTFIFPIISAVISFVIYNILRLGPQFSQISLRNRDYIWPISEIIKHPLDPFLPHLTDTFNIFFRYVSWPVCTLFIFALILYLIHKKFNRYLFLVACWSFLPLIANLAIAKVFTARYILFTLPPLFVVAGYLISKLPTKINYLIPIILIPNLIFIYQLSTNPFSLKLPSTETGYLSDWTSGWGIKESAEFLIDRSKSVNVIVGTEGAFGTLPDGLQIYTNNISHLTVFGVGINITQIPDKLIEAKNFGDEVYLLFNSSRLKLTSADLSTLTLVKSTLKPDGDSLVLYRL